MGVRTWIEGWPVYRQLTGGDLLGRGAAAKSPASDRLAPRTVAADKVVKSVCPYCAVGCGQNVYVSGGQVTQIEGDPDSPVSRGRLCPKGSASLQLTTGPGRRDRVLYRRPFGTDWEHARPGHGDGHDRRPGDPGAGTTAGSGSRTGSAPGAPWGSPASAARRWTTKRTT